jgi:hypothetical protein
MEISNGDGDNGDNKFIAIPEFSTNQLSIFNKLIGKDDNQKIVTIRK